jgi:hypothetical protein
MDVAEVTRLYLLYVILPLWVLVAFADYWCHRASAIENTSGLKETMLHFLLLAEAGSAVLAGLVFEINALVLALMLVALLAHELTAYWDVAYAHLRREITPLEQRVHDYLGVIPFMAFSFVLVLHWESVAALNAEPLAPENWSLWWKREPLPLAYILGLLGAIALFNILPYLQELRRDLRATPRSRRHATIRS